MSRPALKAPPQTDEAILVYKRLLQSVLNQRPSGTRQRLADALGKHRSFVTQMTSPSYATPIPQRHLPTILSVCHFTPEERDEFLVAYLVAHRGKLDLAEAAPHMRHLNLLVPDLGDSKANAEFEKAVSDFVASMAGMIKKSADDERAGRGRR
ncbi:MAG: hypothetical protein ABI398_02260 [Devosia sp.]